MLMIDKNKTNTSLNQGGINVSGGEPSQGTSSSYTEADLGSMTREQKIAAYKELVASQGNPNTKTEPEPKQKTPYTITEADLSSMTREQKIAAYKELIASQGNPSTQTDPEPKKATAEVSSESTPITSAGSNYTSNSEGVGNKKAEVNQGEENFSTYDESKNSLFSSLYGAAAGVLGVLDNTIKTALPFISKDYRDMTPEAKKVFLSSMYNSTANGPLMESLAKESEKLKEEQERLEKAMHEFNTGLLEDLGNGNYAQFSKRMVVGGLGQVGSFVQAAIPGIGLASIAVSGSADKIEDIEKETGKLELKDALHGTLHGTAEAMLEKVTKGLGKTFFKSLRGMAEPAIRTAFEAFTKTIKEVASEGGSEVATSAIQDGLDYLIGGKEDAFVDWFYRYSETFVSSIGLTGVTSTISNTSNRVRTIKLDAKAKEVFSNEGNTIKDWKGLYRNDAEGTNLEETIRFTARDLKGNYLEGLLNQALKDKQITKEEAAELRLNHAKNVKALRETQIEGLDDSKRAKVVSLTRKKKKLEEEIKNLDSAVATVKKEELKKVESEIVDIAVNAQEIVGDIQKGTTEETKSDSDTTEPSKDNDGDQSEGTVIEDTLDDDMEVLYKRDEDAQIKAEEEAYLATLEPEERAEIKRKAKSEQGKAETAAKKEARTITDLKGRRRVGSNVFNKDGGTEVMADLTSHISDGKEKGLIPKEIKKSGLALVQNSEFYKSLSDIDKETATRSAKSLLGITPPKGSKDFKKSIDKDLVQDSDTSPLADLEGMTEKEYLNEKYKELDEVTEKAKREQKEDSAINGKEAAKVVKDLVKKLPEGDVRASELNRIATAMSKVNDKKSLERATAKAKKIFKGIENRQEKGIREKKRKEVSKLGRLNKIKAKAKGIKDNVRVLASKVATIDPEKDLRAKHDKELSDLIKEKGDTSELESLKRRQAEELVKATEPKVSVSDQRKLRDKHRKQIEDATKRGFDEYDMKLLKDSHREQIQAANLPKKSKQEIESLKETHQEQIEDAYKDSEIGLEINDLREKQKIELENIDATMDEVYEDLLNSKGVKRNSQTNQAVTESVIAGKVGELMKQAELRKEKERLTNQANRIVATKVVNMLNNPDFSLDEIREALNEAKEDLIDKDKVGSSEKRAKLKKELIDSSVKLLKELDFGIPALSEGLRGGRIRAALRSLDVRDLDSLNTVELIELESALDNLVVNGSSLSLLDAVIPIQSIYAMKKIDAAGRGRSVYNKSDGMLHKLLNKTVSINHFISSLTGGHDKYAAAIMKYSGITEYSRATMAKDSAVEAFKDTFSKKLKEVSKNKKLKTLNGEKVTEISNVYRRGVYSALFQGIGKAGYSNRIKAIKDSIKALELPKNSDDQQAEAVLLQGILKELESYKDSEGNAITDVDSLREYLKENDSANLEVIDHVIESFKDVEGDVKEVLEGLHGSTFNSVAENYVPIRTRTITKEDLKGSDVDNKSADKDTRVSGSLQASKMGKDRVKDAAVPRGKALTFNFDKSVEISMGEQLDIVHVSEAKHFMVKHLRSSRMANSKAFKDAPRSFEMLKKLLIDVVDQASHAPDRSDIDIKAHRFVDALRGRASRLALYGVLQGGKQSTVITGTVVHLTGENIGAFAPSVNYLVKGNLNSDIFSHSPVGDRASAKAGTAYVSDKAEVGTSKVKRGQEGKSNKASKHLRSALKGLGVVGDAADTALAWSMTKGDEVAAKTAFLSFYAKRLKELGLTEDFSSIDFDKESSLISQSPARQDCIAYAQFMLDKTQGTTDAKMDASIFKSQTISGKVAQMTLIPFQRFVTASKIRSFNALYALARSSKIEDPEQRKEARENALRDLGAVMAEYTSFNALKSFVIAPTLTAAAYGIANVGRTEAEVEEEEKKNLENFYVNTATDMLAPPTELFKNISIELYNRALYEVDYNDQRRGKLSYLEFQKEVAKSRRKGDGKFLPMDFSVDVYGDEAGFFQNMGDYSNLVSQGSFSTITNPLQDAVEQLGGLEDPFNMHYNKQYNRYSGNSKRYDLHSPKGRALHYLTLADALLKVSVGRTPDADLSRTLRKAYNLYKENHEIKKSKK